MRVFISSDYHFTHYNIIKYANRPFELSNKGVKDCTETIIRNHNEIVKEDDFIIMAGDLAHGKRYTEDDITEIISSMNGRKILIRGNHDTFSDEFYLTLFEDVLDYIEIDDIFISHYPCYESKWTSEPEKVHLEIINRDKCKTVYHGHIHNKNPMLWESDGITRINVCVDFEDNNFYPFLITDERIINYCINNY